MIYSLKQVLMERDGMTEAEADETVFGIVVRTIDGENPKAILLEEYNIEYDYTWDLL